MQTSPQREMLFRSHILFSGTSTSGWSFLVPEFRRHVPGSSTLVALIPDDLADFATFTEHVELAARWERVQGGLEWEVKKDLRGVGWHSSMVFTSLTLHSVGLSINDLIEFDSTKWAIEELREFHSYRSSLLEGS